MKLRTQALGTVVTFLSTLAALATGGCAPARQARTPDERQPKGTEMAKASGVVALRAIELAGRVTWQALQTVGSATTGFVTGGQQGAAERWDSGAAATKRVAKEHAASVKTAASDERLRD